MVRGNTQTSTADTRSSRVNVAINSPRLVYLRVSPVTTPPTQRSLAVPAAFPQLGDGGVGVAGQSRFHAFQRMIAEVEPEHLLLEGQPNGFVELLGGDRHPGVVEQQFVAVAQIAEEAHDPLVGLAPASQGAVDDLFEHQAQPLARMAGVVERPGLDQGLHRPLVEHHWIDPSAEIVEVGEGTTPLPLGDDPLDQALPDVADSRQAERDHPWKPEPPRRGRQPSPARP